MRQYESGKREPRLEQLQAIAKALHIVWTDLCSEGERVEVVMDFYSKRDPKARIDRAYSEMNQPGREILADLADLVAGNPRYCRSAPPQPPSGVAPGQDTTPAAPPPESAEEGG